MTILCITLLICFLLNVPIAFSLAISTAVALLASGSSNMSTVPQMMVAGINSFALLAIPFFMMAGTIMERGGVSKRIISFADTLIGHIRGGLGAVTVVSCAFFAAISYLAK